MTRPAMKHLNTRPKATQHGAALVVALIILTVLTALGIIAVQESKVALRLSQNAQTRLDALQTADSVVNAVISNTNNLPITPGTDYSACFINSSPAPQGSVPFTCSSNSIQFPASFGSSGFSTAYVYADVTRDPPEFLPVNAIRGAGTSGRSYNFARFTVTGGYNHANSGLGAAEISEGIMLLHVKLPGVNYE